MTKKNQEIEFLNQKKKDHQKPIIGMVFLLFFLILVGVYYSSKLVKISAPFRFPTPSSSGDPLVPLSSQEAIFEKFTSEADYKAYLDESPEELAKMMGRGFPIEAIGDRSFAAEDMRMEAMAPGLGGAALERVSETNVQVKGIDEPDIVKTDGQEIYFSPQSPYLIRQPRNVVFMEESIIPPPKIANGTKVIRAFPPAQLKKEAEISQTGDLLLTNEILAIFENNERISGYNVSRPESPIKKWQIDFQDNHYLVNARLYQGKVYFVTAGPVNYDIPCPIEPLIFNQRSLAISCTDIYHPRTIVPVDVNYHAFVLDPQSGEIEKNISLIGSTSNSMIYMSESSLYLTYTYQADHFELMAQFIEEESQSLLPESFREKIRLLRSYDLSSATKMMEFDSLYEKYSRSLSKDERLRVNNEFQNQLQSFFQKRIRDLEKTDLVKIGLDDFTITASGNFPGRPLNQFALDEYQNYLRVATTVNSWGRAGGESANDVYVLDQYLDQVGSVLDLGLGEKIYSARFIADKGYLVTFRQIDPFYVLDLSNPRDPQVTGELKIPGYSSYLHPIDKNKILGIGKEGSKVKISLFDVSSPTNPLEVSKYLMDEYWSDILNTHHAFLLDSQHQIFFLPGSRGGYIFSYQDNQLSLTKAIADIRAKRAIYINDYLYVIGEDKIVVLNEADWQDVNQLEF
ncbi:beta-propeller domain-containing protein [Patescibacteria group bacterium]